MASAFAFATSGFDTGASPAPFGGTAGFEAFAFFLGGTATFASAAVGGTAGSEIADTAIVAFFGGGFAATTDGGDVLAFLGDGGIVDL